MIVYRPIKEKLPPWCQDNGYSLIIKEGKSTFQNLRKKKKEEPANSEEDYKRKDTRKISINVPLFIDHM